MKWKEIDLKEQIMAFFNHRSGLILKEFDICQGRCRADMVWADDFLYGMEIKSDRDNLLRLPQQIQYYDEVFYYCFIVTTEKYLEKTMAMVPEYWGVFVLTDHLQVIRGAEANPKINKRSMLQLLWSSELKSLVKRFKIKKYSKLRKNQLIKLLLPLYEELELAQVITEIVKQRTQLLRKTQDYH